MTNNVELPLAKTWYGEAGSAKITVQILKFLGHGQFKVQFGDEDNGKCFSRRKVDLEPLNETAKKLLESIA
jgi:hypothetical protein